MLMNKDFKLINIEDFCDVDRVWKKYNLNNYYAVLIKIKNKPSLDSISNFVSGLGNVLMYDNNKYVIYDTIHNENPLHFDGISTSNHNAIPDKIIFYIDDIPDTDLGKFKIVNCATVVKSLDIKTKKQLSNTELEFYGYPSLKKQDPKPMEYVFSVKPVIKYKGKDILRMQIPSINDFTVVEDNFVFCKASNYRSRFKNMTGRETYNIYKKIYEAIYTDDNMIEIKFEKNDLLITNNKLTFHGRHATNIPLKRKMYRFQTINFDQ